MRIMIGRVLGEGTERGEIGSWLTEVVAESLGNGWDLIHAPVMKCPTPVARNMLVRSAQQNHCDILVQVDDDCRPAPGLYAHAVRWLQGHEPGLIVSPYMCGPPVEEVMVFEWDADTHGDAHTGYTVRRIPKADAARRTGMELVANGGTHFVIYSLPVFLRIEKPYYDYSYNEDHTEVLDTEDVFCHRKLHFAGVPIWCAWDFWSDHYKIKRVGKPMTIERDKIDRLYLEQAAASLREESRNGSKVPTQPVS